MILTVSVKSYLPLTGRIGPKQERTVAVHANSLESDHWNIPWCCSDHTGLRMRNTHVREKATYRDGGANSKMTLQEIDTRGRCPR